MQTETLLHGVTALLECGQPCPRFSELLTAPLGTDSVI